MAETVVVTCCAAPDKNMARKTQVMESKRCRRHSKIEESGTHSIDRMVELKTSERHSALERFDVDQNKQRLFFYIGGQDASRGQARIHKQRWP